MTQSRDLVDVDSVAMYCSSEESNRISLEPATCSGHRLAGVRLGSGSGVMCLNLNLHLEVRFTHLSNLNTNKRFRFKRFGSGSHPVRGQKKCYILLKKILFTKHSR